MQSWLTSSSNRLITTNWSVSQNSITQVNLTEMKPLLSKLKFGYGSHFKLIQVNQQLLILLFLQANKRALDFRIKNYIFCILLFHDNISFLLHKSNYIYRTQLVFDWAVRNKIIKTRAYINRNFNCCASPSPKVSSCEWLVWWNVNHLVWRWVWPGLNEAKKPDWAGNQVKAATDNTEKGWRKKTTASGGKNTAHQNRLTSRQLKTSCNSGWSWDATLQLVYSSLYKLKGWVTLWQSENYTE